MPMPARLALMLLLPTASIITSVALPVSAADFSVGPTRYARQDRATPSCGPCGCLHERRVYHRELRSTYGTGFDPRNFDQTEPRYYLGALRAYPRYWVDAVSEY
jgi:hypothetical protein